MLLLAQHPNHPRATALATALATATAPAPALPPPRPRPDVQGQPPLTRRLTPTSPRSPRSPPPPPLGRAGKQQEQEQRGRGRETVEPLAKTGRAGTEEHSVLRPGELCYYTQSDGSVARVKVLKVRVGRRWETGAV